MARNDVTSTLNKLWKETYPLDLKELIPDSNKFLKRVSYEKNKEVGKEIVTPVQLGDEHGFYSGEGNFEIGKAIPAKYEDARFRGKNLMLKSVVSYEEAAAMTDTRKSFEKWSKRMGQSMLRSMNKRLEILHLYGLSGIGVVESKSVASNLVTVKISAEKWASGIWSGAEGCPIDFGNIGETPRTENATGRAVRSAGGSGNRNVVPSGKWTSLLDTAKGAFVKSVDTANRTIVVQFVDASEAAKVADGAIISYPQFDTQFAGLSRILNTDGELFGIQTSDYGLWKGNVIDATSITDYGFGNLQDAIAQAVNKGLDRDVIVMCSPKTWAKLQATESTLKRSDSSYSTDTSERGSRNIRYYSQNGQMEIVPSIYVMDGDIFIFPTDGLVRTGNSDLTFVIPGSSESDPEFFIYNESEASVQLRLFTNQALFNWCPAQCVYVTNIQ